MSSPSRRAWRWLAAAAVLAGAWAAPAAAAPQPDKVIDAQKDPREAGETLNDLCATLSNCRWVNRPSDAITTGYGPWRVLGDALYNCSKDTAAENVVAVSEERAETTSVSETVSVKVSLGFLGLAKQSAEFEAFSKQAEKVSSTVTSRSAVAVAPMYKGWVRARVQSAFVHGSAYVTDGIHLVEVTGIDLTFPGFQDPRDDSDAVDYNNFQTPMDADDIATHCGAVGGEKRLAAPRPHTFAITVCRRGANGREAACASREVRGTPPPPTRRARVQIRRDGRTYAKGTYTRGRIRVTVRRPLERGTYDLRLRTARSDTTTLIPISVKE